MSCARAHHRHGPDRPVLATSERGDLAEAGIGEDVDGKPVAPIVGLLKRKPWLLPRFVARDVPES